MVFFTCNACGESLKKNQVEKHYMTKCRNCEVLSCVDCGKDFWGEAYQAHVKCITEEEKYSGKNYKPKPGTNKGEAKQEQWTQQVQEAIDKASANPKLRNLLIRMKEYSNIPRKQAKFENFVRNSLRVSDNNLIRQVWDILLSEKNKNEKECENGASKSIEEATNTAEVGTGNDNLDNANEQEIKEEVKEKLSKKKKKKKYKSEGDTDLTENSENDSLQNGHSILEKVKKMKKKRKQEEAKDDNGVLETGKSKRKKLCTETEDTDNLHDTLEEEVPQEKKKFKWEDVICQVLSAAEDQQLSLKKLRKKVLSEYSTYCSSKPEEKILAKFEKKVRKNRRLMVQKDRVKLLS